MKRFSVNWILPLILGAGLFIVVRPTLAQLDETRLGLQEYLLTSDLEIGVENVDGHDQIYYQFNGEKVFIDGEDYNSRMPDTSGEYITFVRDINDVGQIFLFNVLSGQLIQLTHSSTNLEPKVSKNGWVVWEGWVYEEDGWQVFLFDGTSVQQLTQGELSMNPDIEDENIVYSVRDVAGVWKAVLFSKKENKHYDIATGEKAREPKLKNGKIFLAQGIEEFPLTAEDLFILDLPPLTATSSANVVEQDVPEMVTEDEIIKELGLETDDLEEIATPSGETGKVSTSSADFESTETEK